MSSDNNKPRKRDFTMIYRFMQLIFMMIVVFFISFFITIFVKTPHPIDYIKSAYFEDTKTDKIIDEYAQEKKNAKTSNSDSDNKSKNDKNEKSNVKSEDKDQNTLTANKDNKSETNEKVNNTNLDNKIKKLKSIKETVDDKKINKEHYVQLDDIPRSFCQAIVAVEDSRFYKHSGFDLEGIARAAIVNIDAGQIEEGGSTITQQLVKNLFLSPKQSFTRKIEELMLSMDMEKEFSKDEILELYLNTIYFGSSYYGIYDASKGYFDNEPKDLTLAESAMLAGLPNAPSLYSPYVDFMKAKKRQLVVIDAMQRANILTSVEAEKAKIETLTLAKDN